MSDRRVRYAVLDSIATHEKKINEELVRQDSIFRMLCSPTRTEHGFESLTNHYAESDRKIGQHRTSIRSLREQLGNI